MKQHEMNDSYTLVPAGGTLVQTVAYEPTFPLPDESVEIQRKIEEAEEANKKVDEAEEVIRKELARFEEMYARKRAPITDRLQETQKQREKISADIHSYYERLQALSFQELPYELGPKSFSFVKHDVFDMLCNLVVTSNLIQMGLQMSGQYDSYTPVYKVLDQVFLFWYCIEVGCKIMYFKKNFFLGHVSVVWWNYLDFIIVVSGVLDQWLSFLFAGIIDTSMVKFLRFLRIFRLLRILKLLRAFFKSDLSWTEEPNFVFAMTCVIALNAVVMSLELDHDWPYWVVIENIFLVLYTFELVTKLKHHGCLFFYHGPDIIWNNLDFVIVVGAILDQWFIPLISIIATCMGFKHGLNVKSLGVVIRFLRLMRLLRVLRLVRLLKRIRPLYALLMGVIEALEGMKWVMVLTGMLLYMCAIVFTTLVGKHLIFSTKDGHEDADQFYGSVSDSIFSLFKMMNGDTEPLEPMAMAPVGKVLFVVFMVIANWAILAILTSVVSDNMIRASTRDTDKAEEEELYRKEHERHERIKSLFMKIDHNHNGTISEEEWNAMLSDEETREELEDASGLAENFLHDMFMSLCHDEEDPDTGAKQKVLSYQDFCEHMKDESKTANQRSLMALMAHIKLLENKIDGLVDHFEVSTYRKETNRRSGKDTNRTPGKETSPNGESLH